MQQDETPELQDYLLFLKKKEKASQFCSQILLNSKIFPQKGKIKSNFLSRLGVVSEVFVFLYLEKYF